MLCSIWYLFVLWLFSLVIFLACLWQLTLTARSALYNLYASCFLRQEIRSLLGWAGQSNSPATCSARAFGLPLRVTAQGHVAVPLWEMERWNKPVNGNSWTEVKVKIPKSVHSQFTLLSSVHIMLFQTWGGYKDCSVLLLLWSTNVEWLWRTQCSLISKFRHVGNVIFFLLGDFPAFEFYLPTFRNTVFSIFIDGVSRKKEQTDYSSANKIQSPWNHPKERIQRHCVCFNLCVQQSCWAVMGQEADRITGAC